MIPEFEQAENLDRPPHDDSRTWLTRLFHADKLPMMLQAVMRSARSALLTDLGL